MSLWKYYVMQYWIHIKSSSNLSFSEFIISRQQAALINKPLTTNIKKKIQLLNQKSKEDLIAMIINQVEFRAPQNPHTRKGYISKSRGNCGKCKPCLTTQDCGKCAHCLDKVKRGGSGTIRRKCVKRLCTSLQKEREKKKKEKERNK